MVRSPSSGSESERIRPIPTRSRSNSVGDRRNRRNRSRSKTKHENTPPLVQRLFVPVPSCAYRSTSPANTSRAPSTTSSTASLGSSSSSTNGSLHSQVHRDESRCGEWQQRPDGSWFKQEYYTVHSNNPILEFNEDADVHSEFQQNNSDGNTQLIMEYFNRGVPLSKQDYEKINKSLSNYNSSEWKSLTNYIIKDNKTEIEKLSQELEQKKAEIAQLKTYISGQENRIHELIFVNNSAKKSSETEYYKNSIITEEQREREMTYQLYETELQLLLHLSKSTTQLQEIIYQTETSTRNSISECEKIEFATINNSKQYLDSHRIIHIETIQEQESATRANISKMESEIRSVLVHPIFQWTHPKEIYSQVDSIKLKNKIEDETQFLKHNTEAILILQEEEGRHRNLIIEVEATAWSTTRATHLQSVHQRHRESEALISAQLMTRLQQQEDKCIGLELHIDRQQRLYEQLQKDYQLECYNTTLLRQEIESMRLEMEEKLKSNEVTWEERKESYHLRKQLVELEANILKQRQEYEEKISEFQNYSQQIHIAMQEAMSKISQVEEERDQMKELVTRQRDLYMPPEQKRTQQLESELIKERTEKEYFEHRWKDEEKRRKTMEDLLKTERESKTYHEQLVFEANAKRQEVEHLLQLERSALESREEKLREEQKKRQALERQLRSKEKEELNLKLSANITGGRNPQPTISKSSLANGITETAATIPEPEGSSAMLDTLKGLSPNHKLAVLTAALIHQADRFTPTPTPIDASIINNTNQFSDNISTSTPKSLSFNDLSCIPQPPSVNLFTHTDTLGGSRPPPSLPPYHQHYPTASNQSNSHSTISSFFNLNSSKPVNNNTTTTINRGSEPPSTPAEPLPSAAAQQSPIRPANRPQQQQPTNLRTNDWSDINQQKPITPVTSEWSPRSNSIPLYKASQYVAPPNTVEIPINSVAGGNPFFHYLPPPASTTTFRRPIKNGTTRRRSGSASAASPPRTTAFDYQTNNINSFSPYDSPNTRRISLEPNDEIMTSSGPPPAPDPKPETSSQPIPISPRYSSRPVSPGSGSNRLFPKQIQKPSSFTQPNYTRT